MARHTMEKQVTNDDASPTASLLDRRFFAVPGFCGAASVI
jgi:hypothetical protein